MTPPQHPYFAIRKGYEIVTVKQKSRPHF